MTRGAQGRVVRATLQAEKQSADLSPPETFMNIRKSVPNWEKSTVKLRCRPPESTKLAMTTPRA